MRLLASPARQGSVIVVALVTTAIISIPLASCLVLVRAQNLSMMRALSWNSAIPVAEAGIEEALLHLNKQGINALETNGWTLSSGHYVKTRSVGSSYYTVSISAANPPSIVATSFVATVTGGAYSVAGLAGGANVNAGPQAYTSRIIRVNTRPDGLFMKAMVAKNSIDLNGNNIRTDSFDSSNPAYSTGGQYDPNPAKVKDQGDIATNSGVVNSILIGNANVWGKASTGPGGSLAIGPNGAVGSKAWNASNHGVEPGWFTDDMNVTFPDAKVPFSSGPSPVAGTVGGTSYKYVLGTTNYLMGSLSMASSETLLVTGNAALWVTNSISIKGSAKIKIATGGRLTLYMSGASAALGGNGVINEPGNATSFVYMGLPSNTSLSLSGNAGFIGVIYAPNADFTLNGGGNDSKDFIGASVSATVRMNGHFKFHYDEALKTSQFSRGYVPVSWDEL